ncbi:hypothetical protein ElyMa_006397300 [Elysia marginata]|uniref:Uncharacterized protein n=1 Tax=Elysia marginata TaxID=1093978 RepID=A0AAV4HQ89_9GAST|nr:hypothetical protein ElyMa_006397300 [Elysia marginata]
MASDDDGVVLALMLLSSARKKKKRRFAIHPINKERDQRGVITKLYPQLLDDEDKFRNYVRMTRGTFEQLLGLLGDNLRRADTNFRKAIPPRTRLLLALR